MVSNLTIKLLEWYDKEKRILPWRKKGKKKNIPYNVWISEVMLQQTTVNSVIDKYKRFIFKFPNVKILAEASLEEVLEEWAGLGYYSRARNLHASARLIESKYNGIIPSEKEQLINLPGVGEYTAEAIRAIAYNKCSLPIDVNVERVITRLFKIYNDKNFKEKIKKNTFPLIPNDRVGDFMEALMDLGSLVCKRVNPRCNKCPLKLNCKGHLDGAIEVFIKKNKVKDTRKGKCYVIRRLVDNKLLFFRNPPRGLLGGMLLFPTYGWLKNSHEDYLKKKILKCIKKLNNKKYKKTIFHEFSHFKLELKIYYLEANSLQLSYGEWISADRARRQLPTLMKKVADEIIDN